MKIKNAALTSGLFNSLKKISDSELPIQFAWKLTKVLKELKEIGEMVDEKRISLIKKYAEKDKDGNIILAKDKDGNDIPDRYLVDNKYNEEMEKFMDLENEISFEPISINDLEKNGVDKINAKDLLEISILLKD